MPQVRATPEPYDGNMAGGQSELVVRRLLPKIPAGCRKEEFGSDIPASQLAYSLALNGRLEVKSAPKKVEDILVLSEIHVRVFILLTLVQSRVLFIILHRSLKDNTPFHDVERWISHSCSQRCTNAMIN